MTLSNPITADGPAYQKLRLNIFELKKRVPYINRFASARKRILDFFDAEEEASEAEGEEKQIGLIRATFCN